MDKIKLGKYEFELEPMGISSRGKELVLTIKADVESRAIKEIFKSEKETRVITLISGGTETEYIDYIVFRSITDNDDGTYIIALEKESVETIVKKLRAEIKQNTEIVNNLLVTDLEGLE